MNTITIKYIFDFGTPHPKSFPLEFDAETMKYLLSSDAPTPPWASLQNHQCTHCQLSKAQHQYCPIALGLYHATSIFAEEKSYRESHVMVVTDQRNYLKKVPLQEGLFGLFGLIMSTSGCPHFNFLRSMARFHLPFSSAEETITRSLSMYLLKKYFESIDQSNNMSFSMKEFDTYYHNVIMVNQGITERVRLITKGDASKNAILCLDNFATLLSMDLREGFANIRTFLDPLVIASNL